MQVKCLFSRRHQSNMYVNGISHDVETRGAAILNTWAVQGYTGGYSIPLDKVKFKDTSNSPLIRYSNVLSILGGRQSIVSWLRLQGNDPVITNNTGKMAVYASIARKKQLLGKDLTFILLYADKKMPVTGDGWQISGPFDLRQMPEAGISKHTGEKLGDFTPLALASIFQRLFTLHT